jgi:hypothetical protein
MASSRDGKTVDGDRDGDRGGDAGLSSAVCSVTTTKRRRFLWAAWWTAPPNPDPFRAPDAHSGGARSHDEAFAQAEKAAGRALSEIPSRWARAWTRVLEGKPAWTSRTIAQATVIGQEKAAGKSSIWNVLGVAPHASAAEVKRAFHARALATHPDHGGNPDDFREAKRAFVEAQRRLKNRGAGRKPRRGR